VFGAILGAYISARASGTLGQVEGVSPTASFLGGFFLFIGARLGGGCTRYSKPLPNFNTCEKILI